MGYVIDFKELKELSDDDLIDISKLLKAIACDNKQQATEGKIVWLGGGLDGFRHWCLLDEEGIAWRPKNEFKLVIFHTSKCNCSECNPDNGEDDGHDDDIDDKRTSVGSVETSNG